MGRLTSGQAAFRDSLARRTGLNRGVIQAWMLAEESGGAAQSRQAQGNNNWLNIGYFDTGPGAITKDAAFRSPQAAARATAQFLRGKRFGASSGIRNILSTVGKGPNRQIQAIANSGWASSGYNGGSSLRSLYQPLSPVATVPTTTRTVTTPGVDRSPERQALLLSYLDQRGQPDALLNLASGLQGAQDTPGTTKTVTTRNPTSSSPTSEKGTVKFDGKPVAKWIASELSYARAHGWKGTVNSGYRTDAEQTRIYQSGVRPAAVPRSMGGKGSNHEFTSFPGGAVDVTDAQTLSRILQAKGSPLKWAGSQDPVHFSHPHGGSY